MRNPLLLVVGVAMGASMLYFWYCEMFSDGYIGWFGRFFNRIRWRGKNFTALSEPACGLSFVLGAIASVGPMLDPDIFNSRHGHSPFWSYWTTVWALPSALFMFIALIGLIPFTLPEWMYPEYHAAKREEQRKQEAAENGEAEDRNPFLGDDGVYASQLGNVPIDIPEAVGLPATGDPPPLQGPPEAEDPALYDINATGAFDITATTAALPRTGAPTSHGARPARARRSPQEGDATPTTDNATDEPDNTDETEHSSASSEAPSASPQAQPSEESLVRSSEGSQGAGLMESQRELSTGAEDAVESAFAFYHYPKEDRQCGNS